MCEGCPQNPIISPIGPPGNDGAPGAPGVDGSPGQNGVSLAFRKTIYTAGSGPCANGGYLLEVGVDTDFDGLLDNVLDSMIVCNGLNGTNFEFQFKPILYVYDNPADLTKFTATGLGVGIYTGWAICNSQNGTPDLRGKFIVSHDPADITFGTTGNTGGAKTHELLKSEIPPHQHFVGNGVDNATLDSPGDHTHGYIWTHITANIGSGPSSAVDATENPGTATTPAGSHSHTGVTGDGQSNSVGNTGNPGYAAEHNNLPPYITLIPIIKL